MIYSAATERALLCCMLMDVETARNAAGMLLEDDFYLSQNRDVFRAIAALVEKNMVPDLPMISAELNRQGTAERVAWIPCHRSPRQRVLLSTQINT